MARDLLHTSAKQSVKVPLHSKESRVTAFVAAHRPNFDETICFVGDNSGCVWSPQDPTDRREFSHFSREDAWTADFCIGDSAYGCEITSLKASGETYVATSFGPNNRILVVPHLETQGEAFLLDPGKTVHEIWTSDFEGNRLVLGADEKAVYYPDLGSSQSLDRPRVLKTGSDVFSTCFHGEHLVYTGARNGTINRFDLRQGGRSSQRLFTGRFDNRPLVAQRQGQRSSVTNMQVIREWQLLASHMSGHLATYDLRFFREHDPLVVFPGHVNSLTRRLGIAVDPQEEYLYAAGEDKKIRLWSLQSGQLISTPETQRLHRVPGLFQTTFEQDVSALQVTEGVAKGRRGVLSLWATEGHNIHQYHLGQRAGDDDDDDDDSDQ